MGSNAIITLLGLLIFFAVVSTNLNRADRTSKEATIGYVKYATARDIAHSAVNLALRAIDNGETLPISGSLDGGAYDVSGYLVDSLVYLTSNSQFCESTYTIKATLLRYPKPFPGVGAAVGLHIDSVGFQMKGTPLIDGHNYDSSGTYKVGTGDVPGVATLLPVDSATVAADGTKIDGSSDVTVDPLLADPALFVNEYIAMADYRFNAVLGQPQTVFAGNQVWGTAVSPKITFVNAGDSTNLVKFTGTVEGWGVLVVKGNVKWNGTFTFHGLVVVHSNTVLDFDGLAAGTPKIIGSLLMGGPPHSEFEMRGTSRVLYSSDALDDAKYIGKLLAYHILDWYE